MKLLGRIIARLTPWAGLVASVLITCLVWRAARDTSHQAHLRRFDLAVECARAELAARLRHCEEAVRSVSRVFTVSGSVEPKEWRELVDGLQLDRNYPGLTALAYFELSARGKSPAWHPRYLQSTGPGSTGDFERQAMAGIGSYPTVNPADGPARVFGQRTPALILLQPVLEPEARGKVSATREEVEGWVVGQIDLAALTCGISDSSPSLIRLRLYGAGGMDGRPVLYDSHAGAGSDRRLPLLSSRVAVPWCEDSYLLEVTSEPSFEAEVDAFWPTAVFLTGLVTSGLLFVLLWLGCRTREMAERLASEMTASLQARERELEHSAAVLQKANERLAVCSNEAIEATKGKTSFLANTSHELRAPLAVITGFADVLRHEGEDLSPSRRAEALDAISRSADHLLRLIDDLLDLSKIEAGQFHVDLEVCALGPLLAEVGQMADLRARAKGLAFRVEGPPRLPTTITTDGMRLRQILMNLLSNAVKFTSDGNICLRVRLFGAPGSAGQIEFEVADTGIGMSEEQLGRIFQPFVQAEAKTYERFGGTGLGLSISRRLAELLGGTLTVESTLGQGTRFHLRLPVGQLSQEAMDDTPLPEMPNAPESSARVLRGRPRILLADDGPDNRRLISLLLGKAGCEVTTVEDGHAAVESALEAWRGGSPFDVILMDMQMPVLDGYVATRRLRQAGYPRPIVALTAHAMEEDSRRCFEAGCDDYATKPIRRSALIELVARHATAKPVDQRAS